MSIDANEVISDEAIACILAVKHSLVGVYYFKRINNLVGKWVYHGCWNPDVKVRIFPQDGRWNNRLVHEQLLLPPHFKKTILRGCLWYYSYETVADLRAKTFKYGSLGTLAYKKTGLRI